MNRKDVTEGESLVHEHGLRVVMYICIYIVVCTIIVTIAFYSSPWVMSHPIETYAIVSGILTLMFLWMVLWSFLSNRTFNILAFVGFIFSVLLTAHVVTLIGTSQV